MGVLRGLQPPCVPTASPAGPTHAGGGGGVRLPSEVPSTPPALDPLAPGFAGAPRLACWRGGEVGFLRHRG